MNRNETRHYDQPENRERRIVDMKLPLTWLLTTAGGIIVSLATLAITNTSNNEKTNAKIDSLISGFNRQERRGDLTETRVDALRDASFATQRALDAHGMRLEALERTVRK
jgi:hypothetical protein